MLANKTRVLLVLPQELLDSIKRNKVALKGPLTTPVGSGFTSVNIEYRAPVTAGDRLDRVSTPVGTDPATAAIANAVNAHADKLNARLFSSMDYAVIARR